MSRTRTIERPAKWVLAGEHTVLNGHPSVVMPWPDYRLKVTFDSSGPAKWPSIWRELDSAWVEKGLGAATPYGHVALESTIPEGGGLGSSAALCSAFVEWKGFELDCHWTPEETWRLATALECHFHGQSSGMDIAAVQIGVPLTFQRGRLPTPWEPLKIATTSRPIQFSLHDTGLRGSTMLAVEKVKAFRLGSRDGKTADDAMIEAVQWARQGLIEGNRDRLAESLDRSWRAYEIWGLIPEKARTLYQELKAKGAVAVRMTGAGRGGFLVALWP